MINRMRRTRNSLIFRKGGPRVCVHLKVHVIYMGAIGIWIKIREFKFNQKLLLPLTREEARLLGETLIEFADRKELR